MIVIRPASWKPHLGASSQGSSPNVYDHFEVWGCIAPREVVALRPTAPRRSVGKGVQEMHLLHCEHRISVEQVAQTIMEERL